jgi:hypothetical protein
MYYHNRCSAANPSARGNALCNGPAHRGGHTVICAWGSGVSGYPVHSRAFPIDVSQAGVVGEIAIRFLERADWCSRLEDAGLEACDLVLRPVSDQTYLVARLEEWDL